MDLSNKTILVTGATGGIGLELSKLLAKSGCKLVLTCINQELLNNLQVELGMKHKYVQADINSAQGRDDIVKASMGNSEIDGVINLAGVLDFRFFEQQSKNIIAATININMLAPMLLCHDLIPLLKEKPEATILNVGSIFGSIGHPGFAAYCASKAGMKCFTEALARELADTSICISYIAPRATSTNLNSSQVEALNNELGNKSDSPRYVAEQIVKLLKNGKMEKYLGWPEKLFVKINAVFPKLVHRALVKNLETIKKYST